MSGLDRRSLRLVAITDGIRAGGVDDLVERVVRAVRGGATMVQVRLEGESSRVVARVAARVVAAVSVPVIVNDRFDVALAAGAAGVHVGAEDIAVRDVRRCVPADFIVGASVGCDAEMANALDGADYVGIGPVFTTATKADAGAAIGVAGLRRIAHAVALPAVAIGGIHAGNVTEVTGAGVDGVAVISAVLGAQDPEGAARALARAIGS